MYPHFRGSRLTKHTSLNPSCWSHCRNLEENASASKKRPNGQKVVCTLSLLRRASKVPPKTYGFKNTSSSRSLPLCWCCQAVAALVRPAERVWSTSVSRKPFFWVDIRFLYFPRDKINLAEKKSTKYWLMLHTKFQSVLTWDDETPHHLRLKKFVFKEKQGHDAILKWFTAKCVRASWKKKNQKPSHSYCNKWWRRRPRATRVVRGKEVLQAGITWSRYLSSGFAFLR